jgi:hypothetical protein
MGNQNPHDRWLDRMATVYAIVGWLGIAAAAMMSVASCWDWLFNGNRASRVPAFFFLMIALFGWRYGPRLWYPPTPRP